MYKKSGWRFIVRGGRVHSEVDATRISTYKCIVYTSNV